MNMGKTKIKFKKVKAEKPDKGYGIYDILLFMSGILGLFFIINRIEGVTASKAVIIIGIFSFSVLFWLVLIFRPKLLTRALVVTLAVLGSLIAIFYKQIREQLSYLKAHLFQRVNMEEKDITLTLLLLFLIFIWLLFLFEYKLKNHLISYTVVMCLLLLSPFVGVQGQMYVVLLIFLFLIVPYMLKRSSVYIVAMVVLVAVPGVLVFQEELFKAIYQVEGAVDRGVQKITGKERRSYSTGVINSGNNYPMDVSKLWIASSQNIKETLYLKGYTGDKYTNDSYWEPLDSNAFLEKIGEKMEEEYSVYKLASYFHELYYYNNYSIMHRQSKGSNDYQLLIRPYQEGEDNFYMPYFSKMEGDWYNYEGAAKREQYNFRFYAMSDINIAWEEMNKLPNQYRDKLIEMQEIYTGVTEESYVEVPKELIPNLVKLVEENPLTELEEITAFILYTLSNRATYTLTPGRTPISKDAVEYFLFENGKGYCVHFASAATLMYRLYGVPARYATGFAVEPEAFEEEEYGRYAAEVTDKSAHAWTEIFIKGFGWTPVEVTPSIEGRVSTSLPGASKEKLDSMLVQKEQEETVKNTRTENASSENRSAEEGKSQILVVYISKYKYQVLLGFICFLLLCAFLLYSGLIQKRKKERERGCRHQFDRILHMLKRYGKEDFTGSEIDFAYKVSTMVPVLNEAEVQNMKNIVEKAAFSGKDVSKEEEQEVLRICDAIKRFYIILFFFRI